MREEKSTILTIFLMSLSAVLLILAVFYYDLSDKVKTYRYSDKIEYDNITKGLNYLETLPIHFNIINKYFSNINNLSEKEKEEIVMAYAIKNNYQIYNCGPSTNQRLYLCIDKDKLNSSDLQDRLGLKFNFKSDNIKIYVDNYGTYQVSSSNTSNTYKIVIDETNNKLYKTFSYFDHYKEEDSKYIFYIYQGYYIGNCNSNDNIDVYDFMSGKSAFKGTCNDNKRLIDIEDKKVEKLQLYKYELKKNSKGEFYLSGYNPVNKV